MYTRCPQCDTVYRVTPQQLQASSGQVRCGRCDAVFDAFSALSSTPPARGVARQASHPKAVAPAEPGPDLAPTPDAAQAAPMHESLAPASPSPAPAGSTASVAGGPEPEPLTLPDELFEPGLISPARRWGWVAVNALLLCALTGQAAWHFAVPIATYAPGLAPALQTYCEWLACRFGLPRNPEQLFIEASELQLLDPARPGRVLLTATIRNRAAYEQAFPLLELTLTAADNQTVARRVFAPAEYLDAGLDPGLGPGLASGRGIAAQQEVSIRLYLDTADLRATGYRLYLFFA